MTFLPTSSSTDFTLSLCLFHRSRHLLFIHFSPFALFSLSLCLTLPFLLYDATSLFFLYINRYTPSTIQTHTHTLTFLWHFTLPLYKSGSQKNGRHFPDCLNYFSSFLDDRKLCTLFYFVLIKWAGKTRISIYNDVTQTLYILSLSCATVYFILLSAGLHIDRCLPTFRDPLGRTRGRRTSEKIKVEEDGGQFEKMGPPMISEWREKRASKRE